LTSLIVSKWLHRIIHLVAYSSSHTILVFAYEIFRNDIQTGDPLRGALNAGRCVKNRDFRLCPLSTFTLNHMCCQSSAIVAS